MYSLATATLLDAKDEVLREMDSVVEQGLRDLLEIGFLYPVSALYTLLNFAPPSIRAYVEKTSLLAQVALVEQTENFENSSSSSTSHQAEPCWTAADLFPRTTIAPEDLDNLDHSSTLPWLTAEYVIPPAEAHLPDRVRLLDDVEVYRLFNIDPEDEDRFTLAAEAVNSWLEQAERKYQNGFYASASDHGDRPGEEAGAIGLVVKRCGLLTSRRFVHSFDVDFGEVSGLALQLQELEGVLRYEREQSALSQGGDDVEMIFLVADATSAIRGTINRKGGVFYSKLRGAISRILELAPLAKIVVLWSPSHCGAELIDTADDAAHDLELAAEELPQELAMSWGFKTLRKKTKKVCMQELCDTIQQTTIQRHRDPLLNKEKGSFFITGQKQFAARYHDVKRFLRGLMAEQQRVVLSVLSGSGRDLLSLTGSFPYECLIIPYDPSKSKRAAAAEDNLSTRATNWKWCCGLCGELFPATGGPSKYCVLGIVQHFAETCRGLQESGEPLGMELQSLWQEDGLPRAKLLINTILLQLKLPCLPEKWPCPRKKKVEAVDTEIQEENGINDDW
mmetsp:Transcript_26182/g.65965  ORF Transcript_26182/g.65965 Transcript_26182/m.65965 type:complete len:563 (+) Transcript_26182:156-1844(+)|eukprot:CAMPEP_0178991806 /NCGR_PEP_ID=MMETSP0795-20121207/5744_1 /TAXON_ID=88552 /ORGANISM="Amoebophrya sp., Strain Ameob2" /LENGTH=562 /DNA_ID=CAMNT_0020683579 /DNA_START=238 /DNA_END=1926 /DNA_ORIENTATION=+